MQGGTGAEAGAQAKAHCSDRVELKQRWMGAAEAGQAWAEERE